MKAEIKISGGRVYADGTFVGKVEKVTHDGLWAGAYGVRAGGVEWIATAPDGTKFSQEKRKDAAAMLERHSRPLVVENVHVGDWMGHKFIGATVSWQGYTAMVSRYPEESGWVVDAWFTPGCLMPAWSHGRGSRVTRNHILTGDQARAVDTATAEMSVS